ncbi:hypothetical protein CAOG_07240 [Capsaspora owczarzaki ATCC 30864]|uniref:Uncharacterized protein n=1 Tax=Capsaspora owczarzaki (strain ATCC 30864) TaxID=595528 RepID=A0A0D2X585_CAPO3|nr:hypothetical protein CAOG_07240 [Capsaspora owczarzaki ATCC 30864]KJE97369.1 hypothetical protein CAOG_007240 [Capsaspora owczarzaki ATCC 30864]|eukprot:XP_004343099.2 hypothetical protein CAOG_07240 [Capsaspora owczarzaki ATCC 30864]
MASSFLAGVPLFESARDRSHAQKLAGSLRRLFTPLSLNTLSSWLLQLEAPQGANLLAVLGHGEATGIAEAAAAKAKRGWFGAKSTTSPNNPHSGDSSSTSSSSDDITNDPIGVLLLATLYLNELQASPGIHVRAPDDNLELALPQNQSPLTPPAANVGMNTAQSDAAESQERQPSCITDRAVVAILTRLFRLADGFAADKQFIGVTQTHLHHLSSLVISNIALGTDVVTSIGKIISRDGQFHIRHLQLSNCALQDRHVSILAQAIKDSAASSSGGYLQSLDLANNRIKQAGMDSLGEALKKSNIVFVQLADNPSRPSPELREIVNNRYFNTILEGIDRSSPDFPSSDVIVCSEHALTRASVARLAERIPRLSTLLLPWCGLSGILAPLAQVRATADTTSLLRFVDLSSNGLVDTDINHLAGMVQFASESLVVLKLAQNTLQLQSSCGNFLRALARCRGLQLLDVSGNAIALAGACNLIADLVSASSLTVNLCDNDPDLTRDAVTQAVPIPSTATLLFNRRDFCGQSMADALRLRCSTAVDSTNVSLSVLPLAVSSAMLPVEYAHSKLAFRSELGDEVRFVSSAVQLDGHLAPKPGAATIEAAAGNALPAVDSLIAGINRADGLAINLDCSGSSVELLVRIALACELSRRHLPVFCRCETEDARAHRRISKPIARQGALVLEDVVSAAPLQHQQLGSYLSATFRQETRNRSSFVPLETVEFQLRLLRQHLFGPLAPYVGVDSDRSSWAPALERALDQLDYATRAATVPECNLHILAAFDSSADVLDAEQSREAEAAVMGANTPSQLSSVMQRVAIGAKHSLIAAHTSLRRSVNKPVVLLMSESGQGKSALASIFGADVRAIASHVPHGDTNFRVWHLPALTVIDTMGLEAGSSAIIEFDKKLDALMGGADFQSDQSRVHVVWFVVEAKTRFFSTGCARRLAQLKDRKSNTPIPAILVVSKCDEHVSRPGEPHVFESFWKHLPKTMDDEYKRCIAQGQDAEPYPPNIKKILPFTIYDRATADLAAREHHSTDPSLLDAARALSTAGGAQQPSNPDAADGADAATKVLCPTCGSDTEEMLDDQGLWISVCTVDDEHEVVSKSAAADADASITSLDSTPSDLPPPSSGTVADYSREECTQKLVEETLRLLDSSLHTAFIASQTSHLALKERACYALIWRTICLLGHQRERTVAEVQAQLSKLLTNILLIWKVNIKLHDQFFHDLYDLVSADNKLGWMHRNVWSPVHIAHRIGSLGLTWNHKLKAQRATALAAVRDPTATGQQAHAPQPSQPQQAQSPSESESDTASTPQTPNLGAADDHDSIERILQDMLCCKSLYPRLDEAVRVAMLATQSKFPSANEVGPALTTLQDNQAQDFAARVQDRVSQLLAEHSKVDTQLTYLQQDLTSYLRRKRQGHPQDFFASLDRRCPLLSAEEILHALSQHISPSGKETGRSILSLVLYWRQTWRGRPSMGRQEVIQSSFYDFWDECRRAFASESELLEMVNVGVAGEEPVVPSPM